MFNVKFESKLKFNVDFRILAMMEQEQDKMQALKKSRLFTNVDHRVLEALAQIVDVIEIPENDLLLKAGSLGHGMYIIIEGTFDIIIHENSVAQLGPGDIVGELALLIPIARTADVVSLTKSRLIRLRRKEFLALIEHQPLIGMNALKVLAERIVHLNEQLSENTEKLHLWEAKL